MKKKPGPKPTPAKKREVQVSFFLTDEDAQYLTEYAANHGFKSRSAMITAIFERLCIGGMSAMVFAKVGWQFAGLNSKSPVSQGFYFGIRPLPPLIGGSEPDVEQMVPFLKDLTKQAKQEVANANA